MVGVKCQPAAWRLRGFLRSILFFSCPLRRMDLCGNRCVWLEATPRGRRLEAIHHGRWIWTDDGWYWASDEPWGWAAYHYGRWYYDDYYGWIWIPGYDWAPAWVEWRYGGDYIGWAPLGPYAVFSVSFGIHYRNHWVTPHHWWSFVHCGHIAAHDVHGTSTVMRTSQGFMAGRVTSAVSVMKRDVS